jgi:DNA polymerase III alpha subunit
MEHAVEYMPQEQADALWGVLEPFAKYAFNKSHSIQYGLIAMQSVYVMYHLMPKYIVAGILADDKANRSKWINAALKMGVPVVPPDINEGEAEATAKDGKVYLGFSDIKNIGKGHARWIVENRPYKSLEDFMEKAVEEDRKQTLPNGSKRVVVDKGRCATLWDAGCFDSLEPQELSREKRIAREIEFLSVALSDDSEKIVAESRAAGDAVPISSVDKFGPYTLTGVIREVRFRKTRNGDPMAFAKLVYENDEIEFAVWQDDLKRHKAHLVERTPVIVLVKKTPKGINLVDLAALR